MKKWNVVYLLFFLVLLNCCEKEESEPENQYALNPSMMDKNGKYPTRDKIVLLWWDGTTEKIGLYNTVTDSLVEVGQIDDLQWWQLQCIVKEDTLYTFGYDDDELSKLILYKNELKNGTLISKTDLSSDMTNLTIAGRYNNDIVLVWWNDNSENIGLLNTTTNSVKVIGVIDDLKWWQQQCIIKDDILFTFGFNGDDVSQLVLYKNDLATGAFISKTNMPSDMTNTTIAGRKDGEILLLWWNGTNEDFGILNSDSNTIIKTGTVGDLQWWQRLCFVTDKTLYTFGFNESDESTNNLYKNELKSGNLLSKSVYNSNYVNLTISKNK